MPAVNGLRLLIVEDDPLLAADLATLVEGRGHAVVGMADTAETALELCATERPDLVLCDVNLHAPFDGADVAQAMREREDVQSLFVTANTDAATRDRTQAAWPLGLLPKPVDPEALTAALKGAASVLRERRRR